MLSINSGMRRPWARSARTSSIPFMPGMDMSTMPTSKACSARMSRAASALGALSTCHLSSPLVRIRIKPSRTVA